MGLKLITAEQLALETKKYLECAQKFPVFIRSSQGRMFVIQAVDEDDLIDLVIVNNPGFRASIRRGRRNHAAGKGIPLSKVRKMLDS